MLTYCAEDDDNDGWDDEEPADAPKILGVYRVKKDYIPETNSELTLVSS
jgi:hypothetical protein